MPVVFRKDGLRFFFFSNEGSPREVPHIHVKGKGCDAKIWIEPDVSIEDSYGFTSQQLARILRVVTENRDIILRAWHDHFAGGGPF
jgi:hypothetical protein